MVYCHGIATTPTCTRPPEERGYQGYQPYCETVLDVGNNLGSKILDLVTGFGGNGTESDLCVADGLFANITLHLGPKYTNTDHCLSRNLNELVATQNCSQTNIDALFKLTTFETVWELFGNSIQYELESDQRKHKLTRARAQEDTPQ